MTESESVMAEERPIDLTLAICSHRQVTAPTVACLEHLRIDQLLGRVPFTYKLDLFIGDALISRARSQACSKFLEDTRIPYMLFIDDDIIFNPVDVVRVYEDLKSGKYDVIGGIYPVRGASQLSSYGWSGRLAMDGEIQNVEYLATGFMGITRDILEKLKKEYINPETKRKLFLCNPNDWARCYNFFEAKGWDSTFRGRQGDSLYISEDWDFCDKVRAIGGKIFADTSVQLGHMREQIFTPQDVNQTQMHAEMNQFTYQSVNHHSELIKSVDTDLSEFCNIPLEEAQGKMKRARVLLANEWNKKKQTVKEYYKNNENILFDNASENYNLDYFRTKISDLIHVRKAKILEIGCGVGTTTFVLSEQENEVTGYDPNLKCIEFCKWKKKKYKLNGKFTSVMPALGEFDIIAMVNVLPYIKDLRGFFNKLDVKFGAKLYHWDEFNKRDPVLNIVSWPMRFEENAEKLKEIFKENGWVEWNQNWVMKA